jgi:hypothetical protein
MSIANDADISGARRGHSTREKESHNKRSRVRPTEDEEESRPQEETHAPPPAGWWKAFNWKEGRACEVLFQDDWWQANVRRNENSKVSKSTFDVFSTLETEPPLQVLVRYVGGLPDDDEWIPIDRLVQSLLEALLFSNERIVATKLRLENRNWRTVFEEMQFLMCTNSI